MAYCRKCGALIDDYAAVCPKCGTPQNGGPNNPPPAADNGGFLWGLLGCCIPIAGLILFMVWKDTKPRTAKAAGFRVCAIYDPSAEDEQSEIQALADVYIRSFEELFEAKSLL